MVIQIILPLNGPTFCYCCRHRMREAVIMYLHHRPREPCHHTSPTPPTADLAVPSPWQQILPTRPLPLRPLASPKGLTRSCPEATVVDTTRELRPLLARTATNTDHTQVATTQMELVCNHAAKKWPSYESLLWSKHLFIDVHWYRTDICIVYLYISIYYIYMCVCVDASCDLFRRTRLMWTIYPCTCSHVHWIAVVRIRMHTPSNNQQWDGECCICQRKGTSPDRPGIPRE